ncbi:MAG: hypothetical protein QME42_06660 [bacterium]|nr:hypothetical protein [bacterium]
MRRQLRYAYEDILQNKLRYFIFFVQIIATLILIIASSSFTLDMRNYQKKLTIVMNRQQEEMYIPSDISSHEKRDEIVNGGEDSIRRQSELYKFMKENPSFRTYTAVTGFSMWLNNTKLDSSFAINPRCEPNAYFLLKIDDKFQDVFKLKCSKGRLFSDADFNSTVSEIPLLLGYDFQKYYDINDTIHDNEGYNYRVIGFLDKLLFHINPLQGETIYWLDKAFVVPLQPNKFDTIGYDSAICSTFIITDDPCNLQAIQEKSAQLGLYTFDFRSFTKQRQYLLESSNYELIIWGFIISVILFFAVTSFISVIMQFINTHTKEFAIHLLCGGRIISIIQRILMQVFAIIFLADIIVVAIYKFSLITLITTLSSLLIGLIIVIYPVIMLSKTQINTILKRSQ